MKRDVYNLSEKKVMCSGNNVTAIMHVSHKYQAVLNITLSRHAVRDCCIHSRTHSIAMFAELAAYGHAI